MAREGGRWERTSPVPCPLVWPYLRFSAANTPPSPVEIQARNTIFGSWLRGTVVDPRPRVRLDGGYTDLTFAFTRPLDSGGAAESDGKSDAGSGTGSDAAASRRTQDQHLLVLPQLGAFQRHERRQGRHW